MAAAARVPKLGPMTASRCALRHREHALAAGVERCELELRSSSAPPVRVSLGRELDETRSRLAQVRRELRAVAR
jgi:hypothetical protein